MDAISFKPHTLTARQKRTSELVAQAVPEFPTVIADLISQMLKDPDFSLAKECVELDSDGEVIPNKRNRQILSHIEVALTLPCAECDPKIKLQIFNWGTEVRDAQIVLRPYLVKLINGLKHKERHLNLDGVVFFNLNLSYTGQLDLSGMSARKTFFHKTNLNLLKMEGADFTEARFFETTLSGAVLNKAVITNARFRNVWFEGTQACELTGNQPGILQCVEIPRVPMTLPGSTLQVSTICLRGEKITALPGLKTFTLPAQKISAP